MGATPLYLAIILARAKAYSRASATLRVSGTVYMSLLRVSSFYVNSVVRGYHVYQSIWVALQVVTRNSLVKVSRVLNDPNVSHSNCTNFFIDQLYSTIQVYTAH